MKALKYPVCFSCLYRNFAEKTLIPHFVNQFPSFARRVIPHLLVDAPTHSPSSELYSHEFASAMSLHDNKIKRGMLPYRVATLALTHGLMQAGYGKGKYAVPEALSPEEVERETKRLMKSMDVVWNAPPESVDRVLLQLHTEGYLQDYYNSLYQTAGRHEPEVKKLFQELISHSGSYPDKSIHRITEVLHRGNPYAKDLLLLLNAAIRSHEGVGDHLELFRYSTFSTDAWTLPIGPKNDRKELYFLLAPHSTSRVAQNVWRSDVVKNCSPEQPGHVLHFHVDHTAFNVTADLRDISSSGVHEFEVLVAPFSTFLVVDREDANSRGLNAEFLQFNKKYIHCSPCDDCSHRVRRNRVKRHDFREGKETHDGLLRFYLLSTMFDRYEQRHASEQNRKDVDGV